MPRKILTCLMLAIGLLNAYADSPENALQIYQSRVLPLLRSKDANTCRACHLQGVDLTDVLSEDAFKTFSALRGRGWIDIEHPERSKILSFLERKPNNGDESLERVRQAELAAMTDWISQAVKSPELLQTPVAKHSDLELPTQLIRHGREDQIAVRFCDTIWSQLERCANCHSSDRNAKQVEKNGESMSWIVPRDPEATLRLLVERGLIDVETPSESPLRTKPTGLTDHGGGFKFAVGSQTDRRWLSFIEDYAKLTHQRYTSKDSLPQVSKHQSWLSPWQIRVTDLPETWKGRYLQVRLVKSIEKQSAAPMIVAQADGIVNPKQLTLQNQLTVFNPKPSDEKTDWTKGMDMAASLPAGRYVLELRLGPLMLDPQGKQLAHINPNFDPVLVALGEIQAPWPPGYQPPKILSYRSLQVLQND